MAIENNFEMVKKACEQLGEHFDTVQIFTTRHEPEVAGGTQHICHGSGNFFARYGQVNMWIRKEQHDAFNCFGDVDDGED